MNLLARVQEPAAPEGLWSRLLGIDRIDPNQGTVSLTWYHSIPLWVVVLILIPAVAGVVWLIYRRERTDVPAAAKWILAGIRTLILLLVIAMLCGPTLTLEIVKFKRAHLLVLVDDSLSMRRSDPPSRLDEQMKLADVADLWSKGEPLPDNVKAELMKLSRADLVRKALQNPRLGVLAKLEDKLNVAYFTFSKGVRSVENREKLLAEYGNETALGTETAIGESIKQARAMYKGLFVAGVVVISDGRNNLGIDPSTVAKELRQQYVPIFTIAAGIPQRMKDIAFLDPEAKQVVRA
ncbi:MAG TPA: vWA domain-containing protein, partial [Planctomycetota bacterium]|nr:vWA domain-containing protein [Planctomycetota bacterium]